MIIPMKINSAIIIALLTLLLGFFFNQPYSWIPFSILVAGVVDLFTRRWVVSDELGMWIKFSVLVKFFFALIGFYAMLGQIICIGLIFWWFVF